MSDAGKRGVRGNILVDEWIDEGCVAGYWLILATEEDGFAASGFRAVVVRSPLLILLSPPFTDSVNRWFVKKIICLKLRGLLHFHC
jgi:hypothetical protein